MTESAVVALGLRLGAVEAAVELRINHGGWIRRADVTLACVRSERGRARVHWHLARRFANTGPAAWISELAVLGQAVGARRGPLPADGHWAAHAGVTLRRRSLADWSATPSRRSTTPYRSAVQPRRQQWRPHQ